MVKLGRFFVKREYFLPMVSGWGQAESRKFYLPKSEDGWYKIEEFKENKVFRKATPLEVLKELKNKKFLRMYAFGEEGIPVSFDNLKQKGYGETVRVNFLNLPTFEVAKVIYWEDKRFYYYEADPRFQRETLQMLKNKFEKGENYLQKGITPELAYFMLLASLGRETYRELDRLNEFNLTKEERNKRMEEFKNTFGETLKKTIENAGGIMIKFVKSNKDSFLVHWKVKGSNQMIKTTIKDNMRVLSAGFCLSGYDKAHSVSSIIQLAKQYEEEEEDGVYITRF